MSQYYYYPNATQYHLPPPRRYDRYTYLPSPPQTPPKGGYSGMTATWKSNRVPVQPKLPSFRPTTKKGWLWKAIIRIFKRKGSNKKPTRSSRRVTRPSTPARKGTSTPRRSASTPRGTPKSSRDVSTPLRGTSTPRRSTSTPAHRKESSASSASAQPPVILAPPVHYLPSRSRFAPPPPMTPGAPRMRNKPLPPSRTPSFTFLKGSYR